MQPNAATVILGYFSPVVHSQITIMPAALHGKYVSVCSTHVLRLRLLRISCYISLIVYVILAWGGGGIFDVSCHVLCIRSVYPKNSIFWGDYEHLQFVKCNFT
jgi:hypothetical protein